MALIDLRRRKPQTILDRNKTGRRRFWKWGAGLLALLLLFIAIDTNSEQWRTYHSMWLTH